VSLLLRRYRQQVQALIERLEALEACSAASGDEEAPAEAVLAPVLETADQPTSAPTGDVLAGKTSYVRAIVESAGAEAATLTDKTIAAVHANLARNLLPQELAADLDVSLRTLQRVLSSTLGCSPRQLIIAMRMREARRLLITGTYRVNEVAYRLGFSNPAHFSTAFKTFYRVNPSTLVKARTTHS